MDALRALDDDVLDDLLAGRPAADQELVPLGDVVRALRRRSEVEPVPRMDAALRAQLTTPIADVRAGLVGRSLLRAAAAVAIAGLATLTVGASQNRLPADIQDAVASTADLVGLDVPTSEERGRSAEAPAGGDETPGTTGTMGSASPTSDGQPGYDGVTPGGADPADPGTPGDGEPAEPASPPDVATDPDDPTGPSPDGGRKPDTPAGPSSEDGDEDEDGLDEPAGEVDTPRRAGFGGLAGASAR
jgi:hypothetical protein